MQAQLSARWVIDRGLRRSGSEVVARATGSMILVLAVLFASWACGGDTLPGWPGLMVQVDTVDGVVQVSNHGAGRRWDLVELVRLGSRGGVGAAERPDEF